ncbi:hypothetical protein CC78DRAFT_476780, partial [Lojkania enalia]
IGRFLTGGGIDLVLIVGTRCAVSPASWYIPVARGSGARITMFDLKQSDEGCERLR